MMISEYIKDLIKKLLIVISYFSQAITSSWGHQLKHPKNLIKSLLKNMTRVSKGQKTDAMKEFQKRHVQTMRRIVAKLF